jgi:hypothetical protein
VLNLQQRNAEISHFEFFEIYDSRTEFIPNESKTTPVIMKAWQQLQVCQVVYSFFWLKLFELPCRIGIWVLDKHPNLK